MNMRKPRKNKAIPYKKGGFWNGMLQLRQMDKMNGAKLEQHFINAFLGKFSPLTLTTFDRWRRYGVNFSKYPYINPFVEKAIEDLFAEFGITENIWSEESINQNN